MGAIGIALVGAALIVGSIIGPGLGAGMHLTLGIAGLILFFAGIGFQLFSSLYRKTSADVAFVMTGSGGSRVILDGGAVVIPTFHRITEVSLRVMKLGVNPNGTNALITKDNLRSDILAQFYIRVQPDPEHILDAARSLGDNSVNPENVESLVSEKLVSALRAIASQMDLFEIHTRRDEFAERVKEHVRSDLAANGLLLESVTISELDQTDPTKLSDNNVFDAQGKKKITEITAQALVERNSLDRAAEQARKERDVATRQTILELERVQAEAEATQRMQIAKMQAEKSRESQEAVIAQERSVQIAQIEKQQALEAAEIGRQQTVETARVAQEKAVQGATIAREQELQKAGVEKDQAIAIAERVKKIAIANRDAEQAGAEEKALIAKAAQETATQQVITVNEIAQADREANKKLIAARQEIERDKIRQQTEAEVQAFTRVTIADSEQKAASKQAEAQLQLAEADAQAKELKARGEKAQQMVAVEVNRENVRVEEAKVDVERKQLENRQEFAEAGIRLEVEKLRIQADKEVQQEYARALASFLSHGNMTLYGTPETAQKMMDNMAKGFGIRAMADGFLSGSTNGAGGGSASPVGEILSSLGRMVPAAVDKLAGINTAETKPAEPASKEPVATVAPAPVAAKKPVVAGSNNATNAIATTKSSEES